MAVRFVRSTAAAVLADAEHEATTIRQRRFLNYELVSRNQTPSRFSPPFLQ